MGQWVQRVRPAYKGLRERKVLLGLRAISALRDRQGLPVRQAHKELQALRAPLALQGR